jgi:hypothetical protein
MSNPATEMGGSAPQGTASATEVHSIEAKSWQPAYYAFIVCNALLLISALLPWETLGALTASGLDIAKGWIVLLAALGAGGAALGSILAGRPVTGARPLQFASAGVAAGMAGLHIVQLANYCSSSDLFCLQPGVGSGAVLSLLFGLALGAVALFANPRRS